MSDSPLTRKLNRNWAYASAKIEGLERELAEARADIAELNKWQIDGLVTSEWKARAERAEAKLTPSPGQDFDEYMCPNCVTPWKCNGPHIPEPSCASEPDVAGLVEKFEAAAQGYFGSAISFADYRQVTQALLSLSAQLKEKEAECAGLRKDAERYRDMRDNDRTLEYCRYWEETLNTPDGPFQTLDSTIDSARKESK